MKNTKFYILNNVFDRRYLKSNIKVSFSIICLFLLTTVFSSHKIEAEPINKNQLTVNDKKRITASVTYRTVHPFKNKSEISLKSNHSYAVFSPIAKVAESQTIYNYKKGSAQKSFYHASFFEKAMRFNDTLQTWIH